MGEGPSTKPLMASIPGSHIIVGEAPPRAVYQPHTKAQLLYVQELAGHVRGQGPANQKKQAWNPALRHGPRWECRKQHSMHDAAKARKATEKRMKRVMRERLRHRKDLERTAVAKRFAVPEKPKAYRLDKAVEGELRRMMDSGDLDSFRAGIVDRTLNPRDLPDETLEGKLARLSRPAFVRHMPWSLDFDSLMDHEEVSWANWVKMLRSMDFKKYREAKREEAAAEGTGNDPPELLPERNPVATATAATLRRAAPKAAGDPTARWVRQQQQNSRASAGARAENGERGAMLPCPPKPSFDPCKTEESCQRPARPASAGLAAPPATVDFAPPRRPQTQQQHTRTAHLLSPAGDPDVGRVCPRRPSSARLRVRSDPAESADHPHPSINVPRQRPASANPHGRAASALAASDGGRNLICARPAVVKCGDDHSRGAGRVAGAGVGTLHPFHPKPPSAGRAAGRTCEKTSSSRQRRSAAGAALLRKLVDMSQRYLHDGPAA
ncbi:hypothetical protein DIPPA_25619 [Diplonema papillatum]|nr:hypothetical protein DIPPA_25619 [Diplonema papillatum]